MNKFKEYLDSRNESRRAFSIRTNIAQNTVTRLYQGEPVRMDVAKKVVRATKRQITFDDLNIWTVDTSIEDKTTETE